MRKGELAIIVLTWRQGNKPRSSNIGDLVLIALLQKYDCCAILKDILLSILLRVILRTSHIYGPFPIQYLIMETQTLDVWLSR